MKALRPEPLRLKPLDTSFDARSEPENVANGMWRLLENMQAPDRGKLSRAQGWKRYLDGVHTQRPYNNEDLHDQLLSLQTYYEKNTADTDDSAVRIFPPSNAAFGDTCSTTLKTRTQGRQPVTLLSSVTSSRETRTLLAATQSRLYALNQRKGNWRILADGLGGTKSNPEVRLVVEAVGDIIIGTNNFDEPFHWINGAGPQGCEMQSVQPIDEIKAIGVTKVKSLWKFKGVVFYANVEQDGERRSNRIIWSGYLDPLQVIEDPGVSIAGTQDLDYGEEILGGFNLGDYCYVYTNLAIWQIVTTTDVSVFRFIRKYKPLQPGEACLKYPFAITGNKDAHFYMAEDGIYEWNPMIGAPRRIEWIHVASSIIYDKLNDTRCAIHNAGWLSKNELFFSVAVDGDTMPSVTLVCNVNTNKCWKADFGIATSIKHVPDGRMSLYDWIVENKIGTEAQLADPSLQELGFQVLKEGPSSSALVPSAAFTPDCVYTRQQATIGGVDTEDFNKAESDATSLCALFGDTSVSESCSDCESAPAYLFAHASDYCIKQFGGVMYREMFNAATSTFSRQGYKSRMVMGPLGFNTDFPKILSGVLLEFRAAPQTTPLDMNLRIGASVTKDDPFQEGCGISWYDEAPRPIECNNREERMEWAPWAQEINLYLDFTIDGIGGAVTFSSLQTSVQAAPAT